MWRIRVWLDLSSTVNSHPHTTATQSLPPQRTVNNEAAHRDASCAAPRNCTTQCHESGRIVRSLSNVSSRVPPRRAASSFCLSVFASATAVCSRPPPRPTIDMYVRCPQIRYRLTHTVVSRFTACTRLRLIRRKEGHALGACAARAPPTSNGVSWACVAWLRVNLQHGSGCNRPLRSARSHEGCPATPACASQI